MIETVVVQTSRSQFPDDKQVPASAIKKPLDGKAGWSPEPGVDGTFSSARAPTDTSRREGFMTPDVPVAADVEEYYEAFVDEVSDSALRLRTVSSDGEEGIAWLPIDKIPESERTYIELGAPLRISVILSRGLKTNERKTLIRFLRPSQWRPSESSSAATDYLLEKMRTVVG